jgi:hypothetical protein
LLCSGFVLNAATEGVFWWVARRDRQGTAFLEAFGHLTSAPGQELILMSLTSAAHPMLHPDE